MKLAPIGTLLSVLAAPVPALAAQVYATVTTTPGLPTEVTTAPGTSIFGTHPQPGADTVRISADFGTHFSVINYVMFTFHFASDDLYDPNEAYSIGEFDPGITASSGNTNVLGVSTDTTQLGLEGAISTLPHPEVALFLDGQQSFTFWMRTGSVKLAGVDVMIDGTPVPAPASALLLVLGLSGVGFAALRRAGFRLRRWSRSVTPAVFPGSRC